MSGVQAFTWSPFAVGLWSLLFGVALWFAPARFVESAHAVAYDLMRPGLELTARGDQYWHEFQNRWRTDEAREFQRKLEASRERADAAEVRVRRLTAELAEMRDRIDRAGDDQAHLGQVTARLMVPALIEAGVLGETLGRTWREGRVLDRGWKQGVRESALVLQSPRPLIDLGQADQLTPEDTLLVGRTIIGKIDVVGRWTSSYLPVTDPEFRGAAQVVRLGDGGPAWGARGTIRGIGDRCRLEGVPAEQSVRIGDWVYAGERDSVMDAALCYGTVVKAELGADDREWLIEVMPLALPSTFARVQVLRIALNPLRWVD